MEVEERSGSGTVAMSRKEDGDEGIGAEAFSLRVRLFAVEVGGGKLSEEFRGTVGGGLGGAVGDGDMVNKREHVDGSGT